jgi:dihydrofolate synthase / folylpolyglutamate synthase
MDYQETLSYLYHTLPMFQQRGQAAYHPGLENSFALEAHLGNPYQCFRTIHVAGTNGKGSCSHTLAAILQSAGYKVGLYTSPHLVDFRERIRVNGKMMDKQFLIDFINQHHSFFEPMELSFFEVITAMAFDYFAHEKVEVAVIEVGLGGRLDCTNVITPELGIITNISLDHTKILGDTLTKIAGEKAGIIKPHTPIIIGETTTETRTVFLNKAQEMKAPIVFAENEQLLLHAERTADGCWLYQTKDFGLVKGELGGYCQLKNTRTLLSALHRMTEFHITVEAVKKGFAEVCELTGLMGRWQKLQDNPTLYCDTGHNPGGIQYIAEQLRSQVCDQLHIIIGMVNDKDVRSVLKMLPTKAIYYFTQPKVDRALPADTIFELGKEAGLQGKKYPDVSHAVQTALKQAGENDFIYVGGSSFIVSDLFTDVFPTK